MSFSRLLKVSSWQPKWFQNGAYLPKPRHRVNRPPMQTNGPTMPTFPYATPLSNYLQNPHSNVGMQPWPSSQSVYGDGLGSTYMYKRNYPQNPVTITPKRYMPREVAWDFLNDRPAAQPGAPIVHSSGNHNTGHLNNGGGGSGQSFFVTVPASKGFDGVAYQEFCDFKGVDPDDAFRDHRLMAEFKRWEEIRKSGSRHSIAPTPRGPRGPQAPTTKKKRVKRKKRTSASESSWETVV